MRVSLAPEAERDLVEGGLYYLREANEELGRAFVSEFERSAALLVKQPEFGAPWRGEIRRFPLRRFPYSIVYYLRNDNIRILAVAHQIRKPGFWQDCSSICCWRQPWPNRSLQLTAQNATA